MGRIKRNFALALFYFGAILYAGCLPEEELMWSDDGSVGLLSVDEGLYVVDGETGDLKQITQTKVEPWPDISHDGKTIVYCQKKTASSLAQGLDLLDTRDVRMIERSAESVAKAVVEKGGIDAIRESEKHILASEDFGKWVARYLCDKGPEDALLILGPDWVENARQAELPYFEMLLTNTNGEESRLITRSIFGMADLRLSPKAKNIAYLVPSPEKIAGNESEAFSLLIASINGDVKRMLVADLVPVTGYDWRPDGQAVAYINADAPIDREGPGFATLKERIIADSAGNLLAKEPADESGLLAAVDCRRPANDLASTFFFLFSKVQYAPGGRIFFSSAEMKVPALARDKDKLPWSVYYYDTTTGSVANVLPPQVAAEASGYDGFSITMFSLSPDGRKLLLPMEKNRFAIYEPGAGPDSLKIPLPSGEGFDSDGPKLLPAWKGNSELSFIVSDDSHFNIGDAPKAIGTLDNQNTFTLLSKNWPRFELLP